MSLNDGLLVVAQYELSCLLDGLFVVLVLDGLLLGLKSFLYSRLSIFSANESEEALSVEARLNAHEMRCAGQFVHFHVICELVGLLQACESGLELLDSFGEGLLELLDVRAKHFLVLFRLLGRFILTVIALGRLVSELLLIALHSELQFGHVGPIEDQRRGDLLNIIEWQGISNTPLCCCVEEVQAGELLFVGSEQVGDRRHLQIVVFHVPLREHGHKGQIVVLNQLNCLGHE